jgi:arylsulfatase A-like enzyme
VDTEVSVVNNSFITRRKVLKAAAAPIVLSLGRRFSPAADPPPNIVFIMADDLGYADLSCYGRRDFSTPNIDGIAARGMKFTQAYANSSVCSATRAALITGRYQYRLPVGLEEPLGLRDVGLPPEHPTLPSLLKKAGYATALIGKWHLGALPNYGPLKSGYDHFWGFRGGGVDYFTHKFGTGKNDPVDLWEDDERIQPAGYMTDLLGDRAVKVIADYAKAHRPFFVSLHFNAPHWPWEGPGDEAESRRIRSLYDLDGGSLKTYAKMVREMDLQVGRVLKALETAGIANKTVVIFTSDNGGERFSDTWPFTGKKTELLEGGLRIPALIRWPGRIREGSVSNQVMISMDWAPTLWALAGTTPAPDYPSDGISLVPVLTRNAAPVPRKLYWRYKYNGQKAVRDGDMKWLKIGDNTFLFNVAEDPLERANLKERQPEVYHRLMADYEAWNATMLPEDPKATSATFYDDELADHFGNRRK